MEKAKKVYAIRTATHTPNGTNHQGIVGIYSTKKKALEALNGQRECAKSCKATLDIDEELQFMYHYEDDSDWNCYSYELWWYELNDKSLTKYDRVMPK
jgi:hypothetical protein